MACELNPMKNPGMGEVRYPDAVSIAIQDKGANSMSKETKKILFVCVENACRSQMAQGFAEAFGKED